MKGQRTSLPIGEIIKQLRLGTSPSMTADENLMSDAADIIATASQPNVDGLLDLAIRLHVEGVLSEGQVAAASGLDRVEIRRRADEWVTI